jgi:ATPase subunit of ABC transporter with duplicated ATPase domains
LASRSGTLAAANITKDHGPQPVLHDVTLVVPDGARIGLVGPNGAGKSTLLRILAGLEEPDSGTVRRSPPDLTVGYLAQESSADDHLSGGQRARARLTGIVNARFDVVLLDEPTNDLDYDGLDHLERFVRDLRGSAVIVSHDRDFLDRTVTRIVELDEWRHGAREFAGGWSDYEQAREQARQQQYAAYGRNVEERGRLQEQLRRMQEWERRGYGQGRKKKKTKDVKSAIGGRIERLGTVEKPYEPWELQLRFGGGKRSGDVVVRLEDAVVRRGDFRLEVDLELAFGERLAVLGANGTGKTTLLAALLGNLPLSAGARWAGPGVVFGELGQQRNEFLGGPLLDEFVRESGLAPEDARTLLAKFGLAADDVRRATSSLSPGERTRAVLALLAARGVNCLVLDEPTNHLDVPAIEELERALESFDGTIVLVTHDRRFLERFRATRTMELLSSRARAARAVPR